MNYFKNTLKILFALLLSLAVAVSVLAFPTSADSAYSGRDDFVWGINIHNNGYVGYAEDPELYIEASAELGVNIIRINVGFTGDNFEYIDRVVEHCNRYGLKIMAVLSLGEIETEADATNISAYYEKFASRYDGTKGKGFVDYIQIGNEESIALLKNKYPSGEPDGSSFNHYYEQDLNAYLARYTAALSGLKAANTDIKSVINFSYYHYAPLQYAYEHGLEFDLVGIDWYTNMPDISTVLSRTKAVLPHDIIICESNLWNTSSTDHENASEWDTLISYMGTCYNDSRVKGLIFYELMDEPAYEAAGTYNSESHFGFLYAGPGGAIAGYKPIYYRVQNLLGGGEVTPLPRISDDSDCVLDLYGTSNLGRTLAGTPGWQYAYVTDWQSKNNAGLADFSDCERIEFDIQIGDFSAFRSAYESIGLSMWFRLSSDTNRYLCNSAAHFTFDDLTPLGGEWYRVCISKDRFTRNEGGTIDWSRIKSWSFFFEGKKNTLVESLYSMPFSIRGICCTTADPELPKNASVILDVNGKENTVGAYFNYATDRFYRTFENGMDFTKADYVEFDIEISDYNTFKSKLSSNGITPMLNLASSGNRFDSRTAVGLYDRYMTECVGKWYHFAIPKSDITVYNAADWSNIRTWMYTLGGSAVAAGDATDVNIKIINICGTVRSLKSDVYTLSGGYALVKDSGVSVETVKSNFAGAVEVSGEGIAATGMKVTLYGNSGALDSLTIAVKNDVSCDGYVDSQDVVVLRKALLGVLSLDDNQNYSLAQNTNPKLNIKYLIAMKKAIAH